MSGLSLSGSGLSLVSASSGSTGGGAATSIDAGGATAITNGTPGAVLYQNGTNVGELLTTGTGSVVLSIGPSLVSATASSIINTPITWAAKPAAGSAGREIYISNAGTTGSKWFDTGTRWKPVNNIVLLASLDTPVTGINNVDTVAWSYQMPAGMWQSKDKLRLSFNGTKSTTQDSGLFTVRIGTAGTTGDTQITTATIMAAAGQQYAILMDIRLDNVTAAILLPVSVASYGYTGGSNNNAASAAITIANALTNSLFVSISTRCSGTTATVALNEAQLEIHASAN